MEVYRRFLGYAEEYERVATQTTDQVVRQEWLKLAEEWRALAREHLDNLNRDASFPEPSNKKT